MPKASAEFLPSCHVFGSYSRLYARHEAPVRDGDRTAARGSIQDMFVEGARMLATSLGIHIRKIRGFIPVAVYRAERILGLELLLRSV